MKLSIFSPAVYHLHIVCEVYRYFPYLLGYLYCVLRTFGNIFWIEVHRQMCILGIFPISLRLAFSLF